MTNTYQTSNTFVYQYDFNFMSIQNFNWPEFCLNTVKRVDEVVRHPHLVTQDQFTQVSKKVSDIPEENFIINIKLSRHFSQV
jgi:hypothetical protein